MASLPVGAKVLTLEEALTYFPQWTPADRRLARQWIDKTGVTDFYAPPSGGYVAGHGNTWSEFRDMPVNGLVMHVGFLHAWPNEASFGSDERIELSNSRGQTMRSSTTKTHEGATTTCPSCYLVSPMRASTECIHCGAHIPPTDVDLPVNDLLRSLLGE